MSDTGTSGGFLSRWARRKAEARGGETPVDETLAAETPVPSAEAPVAPVGRVVQTASPEPSRPVSEERLPTLADVATLTRESDYSRFVGAGVENDVKQAAMKKLFADPHFNVMDGLDTYIDDYGKPDPIPLAMLRRMTQSKFLRLFDDDDEEEKKEAAKQLAELPPAATPETLNATDDDADLRLQQDDAARQPGPDQGAGA